MLRCTWLGFGFGFGLGLGMVRVRVRVGIRVWVRVRVRVRVSLFCYTEVLTKEFEVRVGVTRQPPSRYLVV